MSYLVREEAKPMSEVTTEELDAMVPAESAADQPASRIFQYATFIHVGEGAVSCPQGENGKCDDRQHFHAWVRQPNQFQHEAITDKAKAARARTLRGLADPNDDRCIVLDTEIEELRASKPEDIIKVLTSIDDLSDRLEAMRELQGDPEGKWVNRDEDVRRYRELLDAEEEERPQEEFEQLAREGEEFAEAVRAKMDEIQGPKRRRLEALDIDGVLKEWRDQRLTTESSNAFQKAYYRATYLACTLRPRPDGNPVDRVFREPSDLDNAAPEVLDAITEAYRSLEIHQRADLTSGNS